MIGDSGSGKTINVIKHQPHVYKTYLYAKDPYESKYQ